MKITRIKVYHNGEYLTEHWKPDVSQSEALAEYRECHPEFKDCVLVADTLDSKEISEDHKKAYLRSIGWNV